MISELRRQAAKNNARRRLEGDAGAEDSSAVLKTHHQPSFHSIREAHDWDLPRRSVAEFDPLGPWDAAASFAQHGEWVGQLMHAFKSELLPPGPGENLSAENVSDLYDFRQKYMKQVTARLMTAEQQKVAEKYVWRMLDEVVQLHAQGCHAGIKVDIRYTTISQRVEAILRMLKVHADMRLSIIVGRDLDILVANPDGFPHECGEEEYDHHEGELANPGQRRRGVEKYCPEIFES